MGKCRSGDRPSHPIYEGVASMRGGGVVVFVDVVDVVDVVVFIFVDVDVDIISLRVIMNPCTAVVVALAGLMVGDIIARESNC